MPDLKYDVLGIGNAIVDVIARAEDDFLVQQKMHKGGMALIDEPRAQSIYPGDGAGGGEIRRLGRQHHRRRGRLRRARGVRRQGQGRQARPSVCQRHPQSRRRLRHAARQGRSRDRVLLRDGDAGRRAHHEHLSRRGAESLSRRRRCRRDRGVGLHLSRRLSLGSAARQGGVPQGRHDRARGRAQGGADLVGCVLRRPLSRRVRRSDQDRHGRSGVRQRKRAEESL